MAPDELTGAILIGVLITGNKSLLSTLDETDFPPAQREIFRAAKVFVETGNAERLKKSLPVEWDNGKPIIRQIRNHQRKRSQVLLRAAFGRKMERTAQCGIGSIEEMDAEWQRIKEREE